MSNIYNNNKNTLTEVLAGKTGYGLLIERDGHILDKNIPKANMLEDNQEFNKLDSYMLPDEFIVSAVFQKYGVKNANGRIYPEDILKREVDKYINNQIKNRCAIGALDHPSCVPSNYYALTDKGWKKVEDIKFGEKLLTLNEDRKIEVKPILDVISEPYKGEMVSMVGKNLHVMVTPNHKFPVLNCDSSGFNFYTAKEILDKEITNQENCKFLKNGLWEGISENNFILEALEKDEITKLTKKKEQKFYSNQLIIPINLWNEFITYLIVFATFVERKGEKLILFKDKNKEVSFLLDELFNKLPFLYKTKVNKNGNKKYIVSDKRVLKYLEDYDVNVPVDIKNLERKHLSKFLETISLLLQIKYEKKYKKLHNNQLYVQTEKLAFDLDEIIFKLGYNSSLKQHKEGYVLTMGIGETMSLSDDTITLSEKKYDGKVYCFTVENHTFFLKDDKGNTICSGNSSTLSGHDVSHNILNLRWEGRTLVGEMKLHLSPGFRKYGICSTSGDLAANMLMDGIQIGVSSRAVGSVENKLGALIVGNDLELIGWDIVIENSTPGAKIALSMDELQPYMESTSKTGATLNEKLNKIQEILL